MTIDYTKIKQIHFVGIKGVGMAPLAIIAKQAGFVVSGCDTGDIFITDAPLERTGITPLIGFSEDHLQNVDFVITTGAHGGFDNPEVKAAKSRGIPVITQGEAVGLFMEGSLFNRTQKGISVAGCHGKTTTTAMIATIFKHAGKDPSFIIGTGDIPSLGGSGNFGTGEYFIAEADEYATEPTYDKTTKFLWQNPFILCITNIEFDHPDLYPTLDSLTQVYEKFTNNIQSGGVLVANGDDPETKKILERFTGKVITFGKDMSNDYVLLKCKTENNNTVISYMHNNQIDLFTLQVPGEHNGFNALSALVTTEYAGLPLEEIKQGLYSFTGTKRRFEFKGELKSGALLYDDYAHHPTEIKKTLEAAKSLFSNKKIICIFQPHTYSRTKILFEEFKYSFESADTVILTDIYPSAREAVDPTINSELLATAVKATGKDVCYLSKLPDVVKYIQANQFSSDTVIITMGAGDVYKISEKIL